MMRLSPIHESWFNSVTKHPASFTVLFVFGRTSKNIPNLFIFTALVRLLHFFFDFAAL